MTVVGYSAWYFILARYPVPMVMPVLLLTTCGHYPRGSHFLGERPDMLVLLGGTIVIAGVGTVIIDPSVFKTAKAGMSYPVNA